MKATDPTPATPAVIPTVALERAHAGVEMTTGVVSGAPGDSVAALARRMANYRVHCVVIAGVREVGSRDEVWWGLVEHDEIVSALAAGRHDKLASELATAKVVTCGPHDSMLAAAQRMTCEAVDHLVVVDGDEPLGVISTLDVMRVAAG